jgi:hypothetical protein
LAKDMGILTVGIVTVPFNFEGRRRRQQAEEGMSKMRENVDTLTLTATPIPRTLQFSLMGARDLSIIQTPPPNRHPIQTEIRPFNEEAIRDAVSYEIQRGGQVFFVHNRIQNLKELKYLDLSSNELVDISYLRKAYSIQSLNLSFNKITSFWPFKNSTLNLIELDISSFVNDEPIDDEITNVFDYENMPKIRRIFLNLNQLYLFEYFVNGKKRIKYNKTFLFKESIFLIVSNDFNYVDCELTLNYIKNGIHFNLFYEFQVINFINACKHLD